MKRNYLPLYTLLGILLVLFLLMLLTACSGQASSGQITVMRFVPQHDELSYFQCIAYSTNGACTAQMPVYETVPDCWYIEYHNSEDYGSVCVDKAVYDLYHAGEHINIDNLKEPVK